MSRTRIRRLRAEGRPLGWILDELLRVLPEGWTWYAARQQVVLTKQGGDGTPQLDTFIRFFDVKDLVAPGYAQREVEPPPAPETAPGSAR